MATLTVQSVALAGLNPSYSAADAAGDEFTWGRETFLHVKNDDASSHTVTIASQVTAKPGLAPADATVSIPAGEERLIGPFLEGAFKDASDLVQVSYDAVTAVTVAALTL